MIIPELIKAGALIQAHDPAYNSSFLKLKEFKKVLWFKNVFGAIKEADLLLIHTEWNEYRGLDFKKVKKIMKEATVFDLRNIFNKTDINSYGFKYLGIGVKS